MSSITMTSERMIRLMALAAVSSGAVAAHERAEVLETEPGHLVAGIDGGLAERFKEVRLACA